MAALAGHMRDSSSYLAIVAARGVVVAQAAQIAPHFLLLLASNPPSPTMSAGTAGVELPVPPGLRDEFLWQALKIKVLHPDQFLPVTDVKVLLHNFALTFLHLRMSL